MRYKPNKRRYITIEEENNIKRYYDKFSLCKRIYSFIELIIPFLSIFAIFIFAKNYPTNLLYFLIYWIVAIFIIGLYINSHFEELVNYILKIFWKLDKNYIQKLETKLKTFNDAEQEYYQSALKEFILKLDTIKTSFLYGKVITKKNLKEWNLYNKLISDAKSVKEEFKQIDHNYWRQIDDHIKYSKKRSYQLWLIENKDSKKEENKSINVGKTLTEVVIQPEISDILELENTIILSDKPEVDIDGKKKLIGIFGEEYVLNYEKEKLKANKIFNSKYPIHVSRNHGDNFGFDILSLTENSEKILIEVKATKKDIFTPFYISKNELNVMKKFPNNYCIYRVYNIDEVNKSAEIRIIRGKTEIERNLMLTPESYKANFKK